MYSMCHMDCFDIKIVPVYKKTGMIDKAVVHGVSGGDKYKNHTIYLMEEKKQWQLKSD